MTLKHRCLQSLTPKQQLSKTFKLQRIYMTSKYSPPCQISGMLAHLPAPSAVTNGADTNVSHCLHLNFRRCIRLPRHFLYMLLGRPHHNHFSAQLDGQVADLGVILLSINQRPCTLSKSRGAFAPTIYIVSILSIYYLYTIYTIYILSISIYILSISIYIFGIRGEQVGA